MTTTKKKKKPAPKKAAPKKAAPKKAAPKKAAPKKAAPKKAAPKKAAPKTAAPKKAAPKKAAPRKAAPKSAGKAGLPPPSSVRLEAGDPAPAFALPGDDGRTHALAEHVGKPVVVYFYPRDDTPGCTTEACAFRDNLGRAAAKGAVVYGISRDTLKSHEKFRAKYGLTFPLLSDEDLAVHRAYGAWGEKIMYGQPTIGVVRSTFLIGPDGRIARAWPRVKVEGHVDAVMAALEAL
jgi:thioredoxin-dependent peroxiredoxin